MKILVADCEADSLNPTKLWVLAGDAGKGVRSTTDYDIMRKQLTSCDILVGHNFYRYDVPAFEKLLGIKITAKIVDTLALSWYLFPERNNHGLEEWGEELGVQKPPIIRWDDPEMIDEYVHRCEEDVKINKKLWDMMWKRLMLIYKDEDEVWRFIDYLMFKMDCAREQERSRWKLDIELCTSSLKTLQVDKEKAVEKLIEVMPHTPIYQKKTRPAKPYKADGTYSVHGATWFHLLQKEGLPLDYTGEVKVITGYVPGKPSSPAQIKKWLFDCGWKPETFKYVKDDDGNNRPIPQVNLEHGGGICPSVKRLYNVHPEFKYLEGLGVISHRISILSGFLDNLDDQGTVAAKINGLTNTLRFKHKEVVNLPKADKAYAAAIRGSLIARDGMELCGSDMSSLEDRLKQHYIYPLDPDYVNDMNVPGFDPHLDLALLAKKVTEQQVEDYKSGASKLIKPIRDIYKTGNYALQYMCGVPKLAISTGLSQKEAKEVFDIYWKRNWAIKEVAKQQTVITVKGQMWLKNPINGFYYSLRFEKDVFSTLVQGSASYAFDEWLRIIRSVRPQLTFQFHDEFGIELKKGHREKATKLIRDSMAKLNENLKLNRELDCDIQFGDRYSDIH